MAQPSHKPPQSWEYFDGATADNLYWDYSWSGAANVSTSTRSSLNVQARTAEVLSKYSTPAKTITSIRWNAAEDPALASTLDIQDRVRVEFQGTSQDSRIVGIKHDLSGDRWMIELALAKSWTKNREVNQLREQICKRCCHANP